MRVQPICGKTWIFQNAVTIPFYRLNDREVILLDSGFFSRDRQALHDYFHDNHLRVAARLSCPPGPRRKPGLLSEKPWRGNYFAGDRGFAAVLG